MGVLSVYPTTTLYYHHQLFFDIKRENIHPRRGDDCNETIVSGQVTFTKPIANVGVLSVYPTTILYHHHQLFFDIERGNIR